MFLKSKLVLYFVFCLFFSKSLQVKAYKIKPSFNKDFYNIESITIFKDSVDYVFKKGHSKIEIISIPKGKRPLPSNYLKSKYRRRHLRNFKRGASFIIPKTNLERYGRTILGRQDGQFVMSKKEMDNLLLKANGQLFILETELGIPSGLWKNTDLIRIDIRRPKRLHLRIPSGNEVGANELWIPGGKLPNGYLESVVDPIPQGKYVESPIILK